MKIASLFLAVALAAGSAFAGTSAKAPKNVVIDPVVEDCWAPGFALGVAAAALIPSGDAYFHDTDLGGALVGEYFVTRNIGFQGSYGVFASSEEHHEFNAAVVVRFPITSINVAPYILGGAGYKVNSTDRWNYFAGGGLEARFASANCLGVFADAAYHWAETENADYTIVRLGVKFPF